MLTNALVAAVIVLGATTFLLFEAGRRPISWRARWLGFVAVLPAATASPEAVATVAAVGVLAVLLPRRWYAVGAWLLAALLVTCLLYATYLVRASILLGAGPGSVLVGRRRLPCRNPADRDLQHP